MREHSSVSRGIKCELRRNKAALLSAMINRHDIDVAKLRMFYYVFFPPGRALEVGREKKRKEAQAGPGCRGTGIHKY